MSTADGKARRQANARLMAASSDMLVALEASIAWLEDLVYEHAAEGDPSAQRVANDASFKRDIDQAHEAVDRAKGQS
jgi:N-acetylglucosamine kinase-like BadF-type ATPase